MVVDLPPITDILVAVVPDQNCDYADAIVRGCDGPADPTCDYDDAIIDGCIDDSDFDCRYNDAVVEGCESEYDVVVNGEFSPFLGFGFWNSFDRTTNDITRISVFEQPFTVTVFGPNGEQRTVPWDGSNPFFLSLIHI